MKRLLLVVLFILAIPSPAQAHGERTQEAFVRSSTVLIYDVAFSDTSLNVGEPVTVTGQIRIMNSWPSRIVSQPELGFLSLALPGPVFTITDRRMNDVFTPQSVHISKGATYRFSVTAVAREEGRWHVHPSFSVHGTGTLVGAGEWMTVGPGTYTPTLELASGEVVSLTDYGFNRVAGWHLIGILVGLGWLLYWLVARPVLARAAAVERGDGGKLITKRNMLVGALFALAALGLIIGGVVWTNSTLPRPHMSLQVARVTPPVSSSAATTVASKVDKAEWNSSADQLELHLTIHNGGSSEVRLTQVQLAELALPASSASVPPGQSTTLTFTIPGPLLREHNLLPLQEPQVRITALLFYADSAGMRQLNEIDELTSPVLPR